MPQLCIKRREGKRGVRFQASFETATIAGKRTRKTVGTFKTKREALEVGNRALTEYLSGNDLKKNDMSFADFVNDYWFENYVKINTLDSTQEKYRKMIKKWLIPEIGSKPLNKISISDLQHIINKAIDEGKTSINSITNLKAMITAIFKYAVENKYISISNNPALGLKIPNQRVLKEKNLNSHENVFLTRDKIDLIFERFTMDTSVYFPLLFAYRFGLRKGEAYGVCWSDIDFENKTLSVERQMQYSPTRQWYLKAPKYDSIRKLAIDDNTLEILKKGYERYLENQTRKHYIHIYVDDNGNINRTSFKEDGEKEIDIISVRDDGSLVTSNTSLYTTKVIKEELGITDFTFHSLRHTH
ncbi:MAG: site-specific integrase, partial [Lachnospiraceae bacterium]|nr:site-specific integrase [Lachnospiraceae bacterium]